MTALPPIGIGPRIVAAVALAWALWCAALPQLGVNPASRMAAVEALVEHGTWAIDDTFLRQHTIDRVFWQDHWYSSKPPLPALMGAPVYALLHHGLGMSFREDRYRVAALMRIPLAVFPWFVGVLAWLALLRRMVPDDPLLQTTAAAFWVLGALPITYAGDWNNHTWATSALLLGAASLFPTVQPFLSGPSPAPRVDPLPGPAPTPRWAAAGLCWGAAIVFDLGAIPIVGMLGLWVLQHAVRHGQRRPLLAIALGALVFPLMQIGVQWQLAGTWRPFYTLPEAYNYPGSYWQQPANFDALQEPKWVYAAHALVGHHGLFALSPWLLAGFAALGAALRRPTPVELRRLAAGLLIATLFIWAYYLHRTHNYGGRCVGMRWWMVTHPALALAAVVLARRHRWVHRAPFAVGMVLAWSVVACASGTHAPWEEGWWHTVLRAIGLGSVAG